MDGEQPAHVPGQVRVDAPDALSDETSARLLRTQGQFAQVMFVEFAMGVSGLVQRERSRDMDFKRTGLYQTVKLLDLFGTWLDIVVLDLHAGRGLWRRLDAVGVRDASVFVHGAEG